MDLRIRRHLGMGLLVLTVSAVLGASPARAQLWLDAAVPNDTPLGPAKALGAIIWSHGRSADSEDSMAPSPPYMTTLRDGGWDAFRFNRRRDGDTLDSSAHGLVEEVHRLKQQGYRQVALAGQSFGAFLALMAADATDEVDAVIVTAPAAYGSFSDFYGSWRSNATRLYPLFEQVHRARVMAFYFHGDDFDPGGRGERTSAILAAHNLPHLVVDQPARLTTHWAAATPAFAKLYAGCILGFLAAAKIGEDAQCVDTGFSPGVETAAPAAPVARIGASRQGSASP
jgi:dienelactone hydrolase